MCDCARRSNTMLPYEGALAMDELTGKRPGAATNGGAATTLVLSTELPDEGAHTMDELTGKLPGAATTGGATTTLGVSQTMLVMLCGVSRELTTPKFAELERASKEANSADSPLRRPSHLVLALDGSLHSCAACLGDKHKLQLCLHS
jgi:hypothetical protein